MVEVMPSYVDSRSQGPAAPGKPAIAARDVGKVFKSRSGKRHTALEGINLDVGEGEFVALLGPSGCGKTTLLRIIAGLEQTTSGDLQLFNEPVHGPTPSSAMVFQGSVLLPWKTILQNVLLPAKIRKYPVKEWRPRALELLERTGLAQFAHHYPRELSGGMRQRAAICRALLLDPPLLLMDEPFGALDAITRTRMNEDLLNLWSETGKTIVFVTHDIAEAVRLAQTVVVMSPSPGRVSHETSLGFGRMTYQQRMQLPEFSEHIRNLESRIHAFSLPQEG